MASQIIARRHLYSLTARLAASSGALLVPLHGLVIGRGDYHWQHEPCWYAVRKKGNWTGDRKQTTLWTVSSGDQDTETFHGTQKCAYRKLKTADRDRESADTRSR